MAVIYASGIPEKYPELGETRIVVYGDDVDIISVDTADPLAWKLLREDIRKGPTYPLCAEPFTMRCALFVLYEWFGEAESCWVKEPTHVVFEGEIEPMESEPGVIY